MELHWLPAEHLSDSSPQKDLGSILHLNRHLFHTRMNQISHKIFSHLGHVIGERKRDTSTQEWMQITLQVFSISISVTSNLGNPSWAFP